MSRLCFLFSATTNNNGKVVWPHNNISRWPILIMSYLVVTTGLTTRRFSEKYILSFYFRMRIYSLFFWCYHKLWCTSISIFCQYFASFSVSLDLVWQPGFLKYLNNARRSNDGGYWQCTFLVKLIKRQKMVIRKHLRSFQNPRNSWMFSSMNDSPCTMCHI